MPTTLVDPDEEAPWVVVELEVPNRYGCQWAIVTDDGEVVHTWPDQQKACEMAAFINSGEESVPVNWGFTPCDECHCHLG